MTRNVFILFFCLSVTIGYSQDEVNQNEKIRKFSIGLVGGPHTQQLEFNDRYLTTETSYSAGLMLDYQFENFFYAKTGVEKINRISISDLSFESYQIPLLLGSNIHFGKSNNSNIKLLGEFGAYYRIINDFTGPSSIYYQVNNVFGFQASFGIKYDVTNMMFAIISLRSNNDFGDIIEVNDDAIKINSSQALEIGFGYKF